MRTSKRKLTIEEFEAATRNLKRLDDRTIEIGRKAMVDAIPFDELSNEYGITKSRINQIVRNIWQRHLSELNIPDDWEFLSIYLPSDMVEDVKAMQKVALKVNSKKN